MIITEACKKIRENIKDKKIVILHCYGVAGSGKSEIIRKMAEEFPFMENRNQNESVIKWHIQCKDSDHDLQQELKLLAKNLLKKSPRVSQEMYQNIVDDVDNNKTTNLVNALLQTKVPVLIMVEDPTTKQRIKLLKSLCETLKHYSENGVTTSFHMYISTRESDSILLPHSSVHCYHLAPVTGFNEQESIDFLGEGLSEHQKQEVAVKIFRHFDGLPIGLQVAKAYCLKLGITYNDYVELMKDVVDYDIKSEEKQQVIKMYGKSALHVFHAIVLPFMPNNEEDATAVLYWKILRCISYFNYDRIPRFALEQCCQVLREEKREKEGRALAVKSRIESKIDIGNLILKLKEHNMCRVSDNDEITFHEVILNAFRLNEYPVASKDFKPLEKAAEIMSSLVSKDMRKTDHSKKMYQMRRHLQTLLNHIEKNDQVFTDADDALLLKALTSYLHETAGAIMLNESSLLWKKADQHFDMALKHIWPENSSFFESKKRWQKLATAKEEIARDIVKSSECKAKELSPDFTLKYASRLEFALEDSEILYLKSRSTSASSFVELEASLKEKRPLKATVLKKLVDCELFLPDQQYKPIFYAERCAFILHSWSRLVLYADEDDVEEVGEKCLFMSSLSICICKECRLSSGVSLLAEQLSNTGGWIPILLKLKRPSEDLEPALRNCKTILREQVMKDVYENGMLKEIFGPSNVATCISLLRYIVRIRARLHKPDTDEKDVRAADEECERLFHLSEENASSVSTCLMCFIYCAKYYAAKGDFDASMKCFHKYFELEPKFHQRFIVHSWAVFNYARAVGEHKNCSIQDKNIAIQKSFELLHSKKVMNKTLKLRLKNSLKMFN